MATFLSKAIGAGKQVQSTAGNNWLDSNKADALRRQIASGANKPDVTVVDTNISPIIQTAKDVQDGYGRLMQLNPLTNSIDIIIDTEGEPTTGTYVIGREELYKLAVDEGYAGAPTPIQMDDSAAAYQNFLATLCAHGYQVAAIKQEVYGTASATNPTAHEAQLSKKWSKVWFAVGGEQGSRQIRWARTSDPYQQKNNIRVYALGQKEGQLDFESAFFFEVLPNVRLVLTFELVARQVM